MFFKIYLQILFSLFLISCKYENTNLGFSRSDEEEIHFISSNSPDQADIFKKSEEIYSGSPQCSSKRDCRQICDTLFFSSSIQNQCYGLRSQQVYQFQTLYENLLTEELIELKKINPFDLKVFFSLSSEVFFDFLKNIKPNSIKTYLIWIIEDWKIATVFEEEDKHFLYMQIFLNELNNSPIRSLRENLKGDKTFVELAWIKQNDKALVWLNGYLKNVYCQFENNKRVCMLRAYCILHKSWERDVSMEMKESDIFSSTLGYEIGLQENCEEGV